MIGAFSALWLAGLLFFPVNLPDRHAIRFVHTHFFAPLEIAVALQLLAAGAIAWRRRALSLAAPASTLGLLAATAAALFLHFNFKAWMPFVNPFVYDAGFAKLDQAFSPIVDSLKHVRGLVASSLPMDVDPLYHQSFVALFFVSLLGHALFDSRARFRRLVMTVNLILLVGGIAYWILPALGPFIYAPGLNALSTDAQRLMLNGLNATIATGRFPAGYFVMPPAAMPSLHIAHAVVLTWFAYRLYRPLAAIYLLVVTWIFIEAVASAFHYLVDLPAGLALAWACHRWAMMLLPAREDHSDRVLARMRVPFAP